MFSLLNIKLSGNLDMIVDPNFVGSDQWKLSIQGKVF